MPSQLHLISLCLLLLVALLLVRSRSQKARNLLPPGPKPLPLIGNLLDVPQSFEWKTYAEWSQLYQSDILSINVFGSPMIILNSPQLASDLLEKRSSVYSSRPTGFAVMLTELIGWKNIFIFKPYGKEVTESRKLVHQELSAKDTSRYRPQIQKSVRMLLFNLLKTNGGTISGELVDLLKYLLGTICLSTIYGITAEGTEDPFIAAANRATIGFTAAVIPGKFAVDWIPLLRYIPSWLPGAGFQRKAQTWKQDLMRMVDGPFEAVQRKIISGEHVSPSFLSRCLEKLSGDTSAEKLHFLKFVAGSLFAGGTDTVVTALHTFFLAMVCYPDVQKKAHCELDRVVGSERLPDYEDVEALLYVRAVVYETLRWQPVTPLGPLRATTEEDVYKGYRIPKGATVVTNAWAFLHDSDVYGSDCEIFNPDRWLTDEGNLKSEKDMPRPFAQFGYGRRQCPGQHLAMATLYLGIASVLHTFSVRKAIDEDGKEITPPQAYISSFQNRPAEFPCRIEVRSPVHERLVREIAE
ncbi:cytochrome p450 [Moniliophthora roreri MCA 2997]|uniref:Cytochrome p450 n=1 Tax=Moniliophthora roreri (strain MCA 2997) TaxID=1381753 RepID=V2YCL3_MONRO|nr:cytochrome p450 [Moniliophthora roreri MCA 2997]